MVGVAGAVPMELSGIRRLGSFLRAEAGGISYYEGDIRGKGVALFVSGVGEERAYETASAACRVLDLKAYVSVGLSASLTEDLRPGGLVVAETIGSLDEEKVCRSDTNLLNIARDSLGNHPLFGAVVASRTVLTSSFAKKEAAASSRALALDMETFGAARAAEEHGVPFIAIRAISDELREDLPVDFNRFIKDGMLDWPRFLLHVITHPYAVPGLIRLGRNSRLAAVNLAWAVEKVISSI